MAKESLGAGGEFTSEDMLAAGFNDTFHSSCFKRADFVFMSWTYSVNTTNIR